MKRTIASLVVLVVVTLTGIAVYVKWHDYQNKQLLTQTEARDRQEIAAAEAKKQSQAALADLLANCQKGISIYNGLTPQEKQKSSAPVCHAPSAQ